MSSESSFQSHNFSFKSSKTCVDSLKTLGIATKMDKHQNRTG